MKKQILSSQEKSEIIEMIAMGLANIDDWDSEDLEKDYLEYTILNLGNDIDKEFFLKIYNDFWNTDSLVRCNMNFNDCHQAKGKYF